MILILFAKKIDERLNDQSYVCVSNLIHTWTNLSHY